MPRVVLYDAVGPAPSLSKPQGGSETALELLSNALQGYLLRPESPHLEEWLWGDALVLQRWSSPPAGARHLKQIVYAHDLYRREYDIHRDREIVCVGEFQRRTFLNAGFARSKLHVIRPILGPHVTPLLGASRSPSRWIYPTSANKGLAKTLDDWMTRPDSPRTRGGRLVVTSSGYDNAEAISNACARFGVRYLPHVNPGWLATQIGISEGLYYTNTNPEAFPMTIAIARFHGVSLEHVRCWGHPEEDCGIWEARQVDPAELTPSNIKMQWERIL